MLLIVEPKGVDCVEQFRIMQTCFSEHPDIYGAELGDDDDEFDEKVNDDLLKDDVEKKVNDDLVSLDNGKKETSPTIMEN